MNCTPTNAAIAIAATATNNKSNMAVPVNVASKRAATAAAVFLAPVTNSPVSLLSEISNIMRSFGDNHHPRPESVKLVEHILQQQLRGIFNEVSGVAMNRANKPYPSQEDFEFVMRNHPMKIARMRQHLKDVRTVKNFFSIHPGRPQDLMENSDQQDSDGESVIKIPKMDDEVRARRMFRADRISQILSVQQYLEFNEARKTAFHCHRGEKIREKFRRFLNLPADLKIPITTMNILAYLAHETIAVIVDYAILTRLNSSNRVAEPYSHVTSTDVSPALMHSCPAVTQGRGMEVQQPISVQEIHEAIRRFRQMTSKKMGFYRSNDLRSSFLAL